MENAFTKMLMPRQNPDVRGTSAGNAGMALKYHPIYQQALADGATDQPFDVWLNAHLREQMPTEQPSGPRTMDMRRQAPANSLSPYR